MPLSIKRNLDSIKYTLLSGIVVFIIMSISLYQISYFLWRNQPGLMEKQLPLSELTFFIISVTLECCLLVWITIRVLKKDQSIVQQKENLFALLNNSPLAIYLHDLEGNVVLFNKAAHNLLGYSHEEMKGLKLSDFVSHLQAGLDQEKTIWKKIKEGQEITREGPVISKSGLPLDMEVTITKLKFFGSDHILAYAKDVTARKIAEKSLKEKTEQLQLALEGTNAAMWDFDILSSNLIVQENWARQIGYTLNELKPLTIEKLVLLAHPDDFKQGKQAVKDHISGKTDQYHARIRLRHKEGHWVTFWSCGKITKVSESGQPLRITGTNVDITELIESQQALEESEAMFRAVVNSLDDSIFIFDTSLVCTEVYGKQARENETEIEGIIDKTPIQSLGEDLGHVLEKSMLKALNGEPTRVNWALGNDFHQTNYSQIINSKNEIIGLVGVTRTVTKEKNKEILLLNEKERMHFLVSSGERLNELTTKEETYEHIAETLNELMEGTGLVAAIDYTGQHDTYTIMALAGSPVIIDQLSNASPVPLVGISRSKDPQLTEALASKKITDLTEIIKERDGHLPVNVPESLWQTMKDFRLYVLGITHNDMILGNVTFLCNRELMVLDEELIIAFINQASAILEKNIVLNDLADHRTKLLQSEKKYKTLVDTAPVIIYEYDLTEGAKYYSKQVGNILGYTEKYLLSSNLREESVHPADEHILHKAERDFIAGKSFDIEYRIRHQNGEWRWFRDLSMNHGESDRLIRGMAIDITEEKRLAQLITDQLEQLKEQDVVLRMAIKSAQQGVFDWNLVSDHLTWNTEFLEVLNNNVNPDLTFYEYFYGFVHKDDRLHLAPKLERIFAGEQETIDEIFRIKTSEGVKWIKTTGNLIDKTPEGKGLRFIGTMMNITAMKEAEQAREEYTHQLKLIVESIPGIVFSCMANEEYNMVFISDYVEKVTGYDAASFYDQQVFFNGIIHADDRENVRATIKDAFDEKRRYAVSYRILTKSGDIRWLNEVGEFRSYHAPFETNKIDGVIFDITDNIRNEERMLNATIDATDRERMRIALEIHNNIQQTLVNAYLSFESMKPDMEKFGEKQQERFLNGLKSLNTGLEDTRLIARTLMPKQVQDFGYVDSVENLIANLDPSIQFDFYHNIEERFDEKTELNLFRITQEALNNIVRHSQAREVFIQLLKHDKTMTLTIDDDGIGFDTKNIEITQSGYGIHAMKSRAANLGARFELSSQPGKGTYVIVEVPLTPQSNPVTYV